MRRNGFRAAAAALVTLVGLVLLLPVAWPAAGVAVGGHGVALAAEHEAGVVDVETHGEAAGHGEGHHGVTHSQLMNFIWHCLNFAIMVVVLVHFLRKPITESLRGRREGIRQAFEDLEAKRVEAERQYAEYERRLANMEEEAARIRQAFVEQGQAEKEKIVAQAREAAERIRAQAEFYVQQELAKARQQLQAEVADMAVRMAEELVRKNLTPEDHRRLISDYLERVVQN
ncbi:F0F1 ATP synthase subunit B [Dissulfurirhabdus thermomarina]|uniref:ATP synthase subunit b n=1 Tax=Dissulfurirhabdus thermomarina TaxID=1765737 RepID=A0A6N9TLB6_DISTH|nr:F0F1 ATP synthase subunit B [Dissulfurirhabdus thermomarina]NDY42072.1 F0F1 ATP synthase subunit B [Dissulfurirhabdus thermomarina]NMX22822.1 F0F1 ATP synthase subunit B [Dissulfurirhabdus thermomarina]